MNLKDSRGLPVSTESDAALESYERAAQETHGYFGNPLASLDAALAEDPDFAMAHALRADLAVMSSEQGALPLIRQGIEAVERIGNRATQRERAHLAAARAWMEGDFRRSVEIYNAIAIEHPRAEDVGRQALDLNRRDPWAVHAIQHVFEMQGRVHDGVEWLQSTAPDWQDSALAFHNWWHLSLHYMEIGEDQAALDLYDRVIHPKPTAIALELVDASQFLWRMTLRGVDVGGRWAELADC